MVELRELVERRREEEAREEVMDVTKQDGLGGFYRYMFQQKTASQRTHSPTSTAFEATKLQTGSTDKDAKVKSPTTRSRSPPPRRRGDDKPRQNEHRERGGNGYSPSSSQRHSHRYRRSSSKERTSHRDQRRRSNSRSHHSHHHDVGRRQEDSRRGERDRSSTEASSVKKEGGGWRTSAGLPTSKLPPPPPGFIHAKPRKTTEKEVEAAHQRFLARKAAGLNKPTVVDSDDET
ncbi:unnamed protein product [Hydatigera taeniaeformis]|uniref:Arginine/serine-rich coiled-coil protein 2 n=1 Tax=Hydatigena taeniaeformis TaxID=6205 RepID=A0A0R3WPV4_HYDTA|nr:unnamed protein product [Hydatigera taeniaeformis]